MSELRPPLLRTDIEDLCHTKKLILGICATPEKVMFGTVYIGKREQILGSVLNMRSDNGDQCYSRKIILNKCPYL